MREMVNKNREEGNLVFEWVNSTNGRKICVIPAQSGKSVSKIFPKISRARHSMIRGWKIKKISGSKNHASVVFAALQSSDFCAQPFQWTRSRRHKNNPQKWCLNRAPGGVSIRLV